MCFEQNVISTVVCETWRGWGQGFASEECGISINTSCNAIFDVIPELIDFFITFDFNKIGKLFVDVYRAFIETSKQISVCKYFVYFIDFIPHLWRFFVNIGSNWQKIQFSAACVVVEFSNGKYYEAGICLGKIFQVIIAS